MKSFTEQAALALKKRFNVLKKLSKAGTITPEQLSEMARIARELDGDT